jgi:hypothetical protein
MIKSQHRGARLPYRVLYVLPNAALCIRPVQKPKTWETKQWRHIRCPHAANNFVANQTKCINGSQAVFYLMQSLLGRHRAFFPVSSRPPLWPCPGRTAPPPSWIPGHLPLHILHGRGRTIPAPQAHPRRRAMAKCLDGSTARPMDGAPGPPHARSHPYAMAKRLDGSSPALPMNGASGQPQACPRRRVMAKQLHGSSPACPMDGASESPQVCSRCRAMAKRLDGSSPPASWMERMDHPGRRSPATRSDSTSQEVVTAYNIVFASRRLPAAVFWRPA